MLYLNGMNRTAAAAFFCLGIVAFTFIFSSSARGNDSARSDDPARLPLDLHSEIVGNALKITVRNIGRSPLILRPVTAESVHSEVWSMQRLASGQIQLHTLKTLPVQVHTGDDSDELRASLSKAIRGKDAVTLPPDQEMTSSIDMDQLIAPYRSLVKSNGGMKLIVEVVVPQMIVGIGAPDNGAPEPASELSRIKFSCGKYLLSGDRWTSAEKRTTDRN
ncbi:hypothetical protein TSACC_2843 [Terrimicrobium sacchariphilum]|uniref:Uncharacterized protein n=2 Tax=Terrimicrobium sacchariphilum TaxID=690879 RepID=A0A146G3Q3_TERSA|nr:hypothetical protein TSACC_2843 [Terrimicrobium sacchariphilum]